MTHVSFAYLQSVGGKMVGDCVRFEFPLEADADADLSLLVDKNGHVDLQSRADNFSGVDVETVRLPITLASPRQFRELATAIGLPLPACVHADVLERCEFNYDQSVRSVELCNECGHISIGEWQPALDMGD